MLKNTIRFFQKNKKVSVVLIIIVLSIMWYFSSLESSSIKMITFSWASILYHLGIFFLFSFLLLMIISKNEIKAKRIIITITISLIVAILDEIHQSFVPGRDPSIKDILIDLTGTTLSSLSCFISKKHIK